MLNDPLSNAMSKILNAEKVGQDKIIIKQSSKTVKEVLRVMKENGYIGDVKDMEETRGNAIELNLIGQINKCGAIKPRFSVKKKGYEKFEKRFLPAKDFGIIIVSTSQGMMTQAQAAEKKLGGSVIAYCY